MADTSELIELTVEIVAAHVGAHRTAPEELASLIAGVHGALAERAGATRGAMAEPAAAPVPAVPVRDSVADDYIVCLEDGRRFKSLRRHLRVRYGMTPEEYRARWDLPADYPMVAPSYSRRRSELALGMGLGQRAKTAKTPKTAKR